MAATTSKVRDVIPDRTIAHEEIYKQLRHSILTGSFEPGKALKIRGLAKQLNCSTMPVREAVRRLVALGALEMGSTRRIFVAPMTEERFEEIWAARKLLEPEIAARATAHSNAKLLKKLDRIDSQLQKAINKGDPDKYSLKNWEFHFTIYQASNNPIMLRLVESLWLQFGPFMRVVTNRLGASYKVDHHQMTLVALKNKDADAVREAIRLDIQDGMERIGIGFQD